MRPLVAALLLACAGTAVRAADIPSSLAKDGQFTKLLQAAKAAGVDTALAGPGPFTVFAPTDAAFAAFPADKLSALMQPEHRTDLIKLLGLHTVDGTVTDADWHGRTISTKAATGSPITLADVGGRVTVNGVSIARSITADNGVIHVLDAVITPPVPIAAHTGH